MECIIGLTANLEERQTYWENEYRNVREWEVLGGPFGSRTRAQEVASRLAFERGCELPREGHGAIGSGGPWYVYAFRHDGPRETS